MIRRLSSFTACAIIHSKNWFLRKPGLATITHLTTAKKEQVKINIIEVNSRAPCIQWYAYAMNKYYTLKKSLELNISDCLACLILYNWIICSYLPQHKKNLCRFAYCDEQVISNVLKISVSVWIRHNCLTIAILTIEINMADDGLHYLIVEFHDAFAVLRTVPTPFSRYIYFYFGSSKRHTAGD